MYRFQQWPCLFSYALTDVFYASYWPRFPSFAAEGNAQVSDQFVGSVSVLWSRYHTSCVFEPLLKILNFLRNVCDGNSRHLLVQGITGTEGMENQQHTHHVIRLSCLDSQGLLARGTSSPLQPLVIRFV